MRVVVLPIRGTGMNKTLSTLVYVLVFLVSFVFFVIWFFPFDTVVGDYMAGIEDLTDGQYRIMVSKREINLIFDSEVKDLHVQKRQEEGSFRDIFYASELKFGFSLLSAISGAASLSFDAKFLEGKMGGEVYWADAKKIVRLDLDKVPFATVPIVEDLLPIKLFGTMVGDFDLSYGKEFELAKAQSKIRLKIHDFRTGDIGLKRDLGLELQPPLGNNKDPKDDIKDPIPALGLATPEAGARVELTLDRGRISIERLTLPGSDLNLDLEGQIRTSDKKNKASIADLSGRFKVSQQLETDYEQIFATFENSKDADGYCAVEINGDPKKPDSYTICQINGSQFVPK